MYSFKSRFSFIHWDLFDRSMSAPAPTTPASPNKKKFSFKFPSVHDHEKHHERRNFSEEALSTSDLQVNVILSVLYIVLNIHRMESQNYFYGTISSVPFVIFRLILNIIILGASSCSSHVCWKCLPFFHRRGKLRSSWYDLHAALVA